MSSHENCAEKSCCCKCKSQVELFKHPWNNTYKGSTSEPTGLYACTLPKDMSDMQEAIVFDRKHGSCECFLKR